jgi:hypothetical protein
MELLDRKNQVLGLTRMIRSGYRYRERQQMREELKAFFEVIDEVPTARLSEFVSKLSHEPGSGLPSMYREAQRRLDAAPRR